MEIKACWAAAEPSDEAVTVNPPNNEAAICFFFSSAAVGSGGAVDLRVTVACALALPPAGMLATEAEEEALPLPPQA